ncbi:cytochrome b [Microbulbifer sp. OS29]|uniref:Cytochrome b n=1 Tax=Microbulbifer okhotskensis TaxID=2926617 RepID=A0A9X2J3Y8_9GAMM|nr:cytochrome b [Microbulbifer okhotskensis]MCO1333568.1 cytochrome b [Microbulbifer okhotskensis]
MQARNSATGYGWVAIALHWLMAPAVIGTFILGWWMRQLSYYDPWYRQAPEIHKGVGIILLALLLFRLLWRLFNSTPVSSTGTPPWQRRIAGATHGIFYTLLFAIMISGYLISTADGRPIDVFGLFSIPASLQDLPDQEDFAGSIHEILAWSLIGLLVLHILASLKHHFIDRDATLRRMLGIRAKNSEKDHSHVETTLSTPQ